MSKLICKDCNNELFYFYIENGYKVYKCDRCKNKSESKIKKLNLLQKIDYVFWQLGLISVNECPICRNKLLQSGYKGYYNCIKDDCLFNEPNKWGGK